MSWIIGCRGRMSYDENDAFDEEHAKHLARAHNDRTWGMSARREMLDAVKRLHTVAPALLAFVGLVAKTRPAGNNPEDDARLLNGFIQDAKRLCATADGEAFDTIGDEPSPAPAL